jgi:hypothetical protein
VRDDTERLRDILKAIDSILKYARRGKMAFESDERIRLGFYIIFWSLERLQLDFPIHSSNNPAICLGGK